ncbi:hypothetical protein HOP50_16g77790 [Chloropicon primus]|uniref:Uncharacterized protein n=1 Tax=Chloropicon primus TaxID=1764295 RepID=A0A5B8MXD4_9CHLO|nr:hypothetical protein A3770_16p77510 [Chloropicon primus]UPR04438.1 hypothetical protein HOP50_16g77790 [Chloropicon primus]|mmetsp:Transcript_6660/g.19529  ORF Transcript_6660/g.19529 Transcript_6660/m.19529 type:complete len:185 (-) Transcript_6660:95-649(-)|eukprot:QDZ25233.1 hypothetical protein A3770_16p77510 [Chloropicon primus]
MSTTTAAEWRPGMVRGIAWEGSRRRARTRRGRGGGTGVAVVAAIAVLCLCAVLASSSESPQGTRRRLVQQQEEESYCECEGEDLACPEGFMKNFEASEDIKEEGDRAMWALECTGFNYSDGVTDAVCPDRCKQEIERIYGASGYCACVSSKAREQMSKQSFTLLNMSPNQILSACFRACNFSLP